MRNIRDMIEEGFLCFVLGLMLAIAFLAIVVGDGSKGLIDLL